MTEPFSPAAQAVLDAALETDFEIDFTNLDVTVKASKKAVAAAAIRAAADQAVPDQGDIWTRDLRGDAWVRWEERKLIRSELLAIAAELETDD